MSFKHGERPKVRTKKGEKALRDIDTYQNRFHGNLLPYAPLKRITGRILRETNPRIQMRKTAVKKIIDEVENHAVCQFKAAQLLAIHAGRVTIQKEDMETANKVWSLLRGEEIRTIEPINERFSKKRKRKHQKDIEHKKTEKKQKRREKREELKQKKHPKTTNRVKKKKRTPDLLNNSESTIGQASSDYIRDIDRVLFNRTPFPIEEEEEEEEDLPLIHSERNRNIMTSEIEEIREEKEEDEEEEEEEEEPIIEKSKYTYKTKLASESYKNKPPNNSSKFKNIFLARGIAFSSSSEEEEEESSHNDDDDYKDEEDSEYDSKKEIDESEEEEKGPKKKRKIKGIG